MDIYWLELGKTPRKEIVSDLAPIYCEQLKRVFPDLADRIHVVNDTVMLKYTINSPPEEWARTYSILHSLPLRWDEEAIQQIINKSVAEHWTKDVIEENKCVHTEHCCKEHGCKYGEDDCPVYTGEKKQSSPCEVCDAFW